MNLTDILKTAVQSPEVIWEDNKRQAGKLKKRVSILIGKYQLGEAVIPSVILSIAKARIESNSLTIYLPNIGSSGSHLVQDAISRSWSSIPLGEVYISPKLVPIVKRMTKSDQHLFMEAWHLLHGMDYSHLFNLESVVINTVHNATLGRFSEWTSNHKSCLIVRNPVDLVISRTFRKDEYRKYVSSSENDHQYLIRNIELVKGFYDNAVSSGYLNKILFEDILTKPERAALVVESMMSPLDSKQGFQESLHQSLNDGEATNQFSGEKIFIPSEYREIAKKELSATSLSLGYEP